MAINNEKAFDRQRLEVGTGAAVRPNLPSSPKTSRIYFSIEDAPVRYCYHGGDPTTGSGHLAASGSSWSIDGIENCARLTFISTSGTAFVEVTLEAS